MIPVVPVCKDKIKSICIQSLSVSQIGGFGFALAGSVYWVFTTETWSDSYVVSIFTKSAIILSVLYYYLCNWFVEERLITLLRCLGKSAWVEWLIRLSAFCLILYMIYLMTIYTAITKRAGVGNSVPIICWCILYMFLIYIVWDFILLRYSYIVKVTKKELSKILKDEFKKFLFTDLFGLVAAVLLVLSCWLNDLTKGETPSSSTSTGVGFLAGMSCVCLIIPVLFSPDARKYIFVELPKRFFSRLTLR